MSGKFGYTKFSSATSHSKRKQVVKSKTGNFFVKSLRVFDEQDDSNDVEMNVLQDEPSEVDSHLLGQVGHTGTTDSSNDVIGGNGYKVDLLDYGNRACFEESVLDEKLNWVNSTPECMIVSDARIRELKKKKFDSSVARKKLELARNEVHPSWTSRVYTANKEKIVLIFGKKGEHLRFKNGKIVKPKKIKVVPKDLNLKFGKNKKKKKVKKDKTKKIEMKGRNPEIQIDEERNTIKGGHEKMDTLLMTEIGNTKEDDSPNEKRIDNKPVDEEETSDGDDFFLDVGTEKSNTQASIHDTNESEDDFFIESKTTTKPQIEKIDTNKEENQKTPKKKKKSSKQKPKKDIKQDSTKNTHVENTNEDTCFVSKPKKTTISFKKAKQNGKSKEESIKEAMLKLKQMKEKLNNKP